MLKSRYFHIATHNMSLLKFATKTAEKAGKLILKQSKKKFKVEEKSKNDFVTEVDKAAEALIIKEIKAKYPDHAILAEEDSFAKSNEDLITPITEAKYLWIIDPIDGTNNFRRGIPFYAVSIGIFELRSIEETKNYGFLDGELKIGVVHAPKLGLTYTAEKGKGAKLNGKKIETSKVSKLDRALFSTGFHGAYKIPNLEYFKEILGHSQGIRRMGSAALDLCHVAEGQYEGYWEFGLKPWDIAAGALIVEEAGGCVTDTNGNLIDLFGKDIFASNGKIHKQTLDLFKKIR